MLFELCVRHEILCNLFRKLDRFFQYVIFLGILSNVHRDSCRFMGKILTSKRVDCDYRAHYISIQCAQGTCIMCWCCFCLSIHNTRLNSFTIEGQWLKLISLTPNCTSACHFHRWSILFCRQKMSNGYIHLLMKQNLTSDKKHLPLTLTSLYGWFWTVVLHMNR